MSAHATSDEAARRTLVVAPTEVEEQGEKFRPIDREIVRRLLGYMWRSPRLQWTIIWYAVALATVNCLVPLAFTETVRRTIERPEWWTGATGLKPLVGVEVGAASLLALAAVYYLLMGARMRAVSRLAERVVFDLRHDIFAHVQRLDMAYFDRTKLGRILSRGTGDVNAVRTAVAEVIPRTLIHGLMIVGLFAIMAWYDLLLASIIAALGPVLWLVSSVFRRRMGHAYRRVQESFSRLTANLAEAVSGMRVTQAFAREDRNAAMFRRLCLEHRDRNMRAARVQGVYIPVFEVASQIVAVVIVTLGGWRVATGSMEVSDLLGFLLCTGGFFISVIILAELYNTTLQAMAGGERIFALLDEPVTVVDAPGARALERTGRGALVELEGVVFGYDPARPVIRGVSFRAEPGEVVAVVGHTGSGKTTIVSLINRLYDRQGGEIRIDGEPVESYTLASLRASIGLVLQDNFLFAGSVRDNIRFGRPDASDGEVRDACAALDCLDILEALPGGLDAPVGERGGGLSLGQRQLVCFARAMLADPRLLVLDEATSAVDTFTEDKVQRALERLMEDRTSIVVAHRLSTVRRADRILVMEAGEVVERGDHAELLASGGRYAELYTEFVRLTAE